MEFVSHSICLGLSFFLTELVISNSEQNMSGHYNLFPSVEMSIELRPTELPFCSYLPINSSKVNICSQ
jgi:hypothetical protein